MKAIRSSVVVPLFAYLLAPQARMEAQVPTYWGELRPGSYAVGYQVIRAWDRSRTVRPGDSAPESHSAGEPDRLMEVRIWYPVEESTAGTELTYHDYVQTDPADGPRGRLTREKESRALEIHRYAAGMYAKADSAGLIEQVMAMRAAARKNASPRTGRFPAVAYSPGLNNPSEENIVLWEYLASHGYVVAVTAAQGFQSVNERPGPITLETRIRDLEYVIGRLRTLPNVDPDRLAAMGFSYGGAAALLTAMRNSHVDAVVGLDPSFCNVRRFDALRAWPFFDEAWFRVPLLYVDNVTETSDYSLAGSLRYADRYAIEVHGLDHIDFDSYAMLYADAMGIPAPQDRVLRFRTAFYRKMVRTVRAFLDARLAEQAEREGVPGLEAIWEDFPSDSFTLRHKQRTDLPPSEEVVVRVLADDAARGMRLLRQVEEGDPLAKIVSEEGLRRIGSVLYREGATAAAIEVLKWSVKIRPNLAHPRITLAELYRLAGDRRRAIRYFESGLRLLPRDPHESAAEKERLETYAQEKLRELRGSQ